MARAQGKVVLGTLWSEWILCWDVFILHCAKKKIRLRAIWRRCVILLSMFGDTLGAAFTISGWGLVLDGRGCLIWRRNWIKRWRSTVIRNRQDLNMKLVRLAKRSGCRISLGTDSHGPWQLRFIELGLASAAGWRAARAHSKFHEQRRITDMGIECSRRGECQMTLRVCTDR